MLRDDSIRVAKKARADGISVKLEVWPGMFHVFQSHEPLLPEAREAIDHIAEFMRSSLLLKRNIPYEEFVFASTNDRLLPSVDMATIVRDAAKPIHRAYDHIAEYGGDPNRSCESSIVSTLETSSGR